MSRAEVHDICLGVVPSTLTQEVIDAIIDCAVKEANELVWKQLNDLAVRCEAIGRGEVQE